MKFYHINSSTQSIVFKLLNDSLPTIIYWGKKLSEETDLKQIDIAGCYDLAGGMIDTVIPIDILPQGGNSFAGQAGLAIRSMSGSKIYPRFSLRSVEATNSKFFCAASDNELGLFYNASFCVDHYSNVIVSSAELKSKEPLVVDWFSAPVIPIDDYTSELVEFSGRWIGELQTTQVKWIPGARARDNPTGRSGHEHFPAVFIINQNSNNNSGTAYGLHYGWSGGHKMVAEELPDGRRQIQMGHASGSYREASLRFETAPLYMAYGDHGLNSVSTQFQKFLSGQLKLKPARKKPRPIHFNCWEAVYFKHSPERLKELAQKAADLGAERFVLDDGWFGKRKSDKTSLGDWNVDYEKYPNGLSPLIDHIKDLGLEFGIWFEPEMVSIESELYSNHPDWVLGSPDQSLGRNQLVLDMSKPEVIEYLFNSINEILLKYDIDYIKWDHNRVLPIVDANQTHGLYDLLARLNRSYPDLEIESCSSGGGRMDFGILNFTQRVWLSDSNDAVERMRIQNNSAMFFPPSVIGCHVGPRKCHTTRREIDISTRAWVAAQGHLGFEFDLNELTEAETLTLKEVVNWWKGNRPWRMDALRYRLDVPDPALLGELQVSENGDNFVAFIAQVNSSAQALSRKVKLSGLNRKSSYKIKLVNYQKRENISRGAMPIKNQIVEASGEMMMEFGVRMPIANPQTLWVLEGTRK